MAFEITTDSLAPSIYEKKVDLADLTATSAVQDLGKKFSKFKLTVYVKAFTSGTPTFRLAIADDLAFTSNVRDVAQLTMFAADEQCGIVEGIAPKGGQQFARVILQAGVGTYDTRIESGN